MLYTRPHPFLPLSITPYIPCHFMAELVELHRARLVYGMLLAKNKKGQKTNSFLFFIMLLSPIKMAEQILVATGKTSTKICQTKMIRIFVVNNAHQTGNCLNKCFGQTITISPTTLKSKRFHRAAEKAELNLLFASAEEFLPFLHVAVQQFLIGNNTCLLACWLAQGASRPSVTYPHELMRIP